MSFRMPVLSCKAGVQMNLIIHPFKGEILQCRPPLNVHPSSCIHCTPPLSLPPRGPSAGHLPAGFCAPHSALPSPPPLHATEAPSVPAALQPPLELLPRTCRSSTSLLRASSPSGAWPMIDAGHPLLAK